ncbi:hypothetical protein ABE525_14330 [Pseudomonas wadenswilerensis]|uniref:hypothetical protein n=1 Tax=Pseudomonas wadenswilerensis TaxID=1785161 RepID=UPI00320795FD
MIRVQRGAAPSVLDGAQSAGQDETLRAIAHIVNATPGTPPPPFEFSVYKDPEIVEALRVLFHKKCAYCEFNYAAGGPEDIEHFRPKGAVVINGKMSKPGYYWLAADWDNLLPSCIDCNRKRGKTFADDSTGMSGKANLFPVVNEMLRWRDHAAQKNEIELLLNPCVDDPEQHLEFLAKGLVRPRTIQIDANLVPSPKGQVSIEVYGLLRRDLVEQRQLKEKRVKAALERALKAIEMMRQADNPALKQDLKEHARQLLEDARSHLAPNEPFLAVARTIFKNYGLNC